ncbi:inosine-5'-monophosphate dehydrogenase, partial [Streptococcus agalactiae H36B]
ISKKLLNFLRQQKMNFWTSSLVAGWQSRCNLLILLNVQKLCLKAGADAIVIDTAHGHSAGVLRKIAEIRAHFPNRT